MAYGFEYVRHAQNLALNLGDWPIDKDDLGKFKKGDAVKLTDGLLAKVSEDDAGPVVGVFGSDGMIADLKSAGELGGDIAKALPTARMARVYDDPGNVYRVTVKTGDDLPNPGDLVSFADARTISTSELATNKHILVLTVHADTREADVRFTETVK